MKIALVLIVGCLAVVAVSGVPREYTTKYDNIDLDQILQNRRLVDSYFKCLMETGKCTTDGRELKEHLPDAITNECASCNERQKEGANKVIKHLMENEPEMWKALTQKYDPEGKYQQRYNAMKNQKDGEQGEDAEKSA